MRLILTIFFISLSLAGVSQDKIRIACVGNSITYGARVEDRERNSYPSRLATKLGGGYEVRNFGKSGATLLRKGDLPYWTSTEYKDALAFNPNIVFIKLGTNDSKPVNRNHLKEFAQDYKDLIASFQNLPSKPRVVILLPVPVFSTDTTSITARDVELRIIPAARQVAYETGVEVINLYNYLIDAPQMFPDKVHPNVEGAGEIANRVAAYLQQNGDTQFDLMKNLQVNGVSFNFHGFQGYDFQFRGRGAKVVAPKRVAEGHPWVWRARFWGHEPQMDIAMLERGFHIVYCDVAELFGNAEALSIWNDYYKILRKGGLAKKSAMEGMSRGGVYIYRWAVKYPKRVNAIYADAPVLDLKSWPGGKGNGKVGVKEWEIFKKDFGFNTEEEALGFKGNPLDLTRKIARTHIPLLHVVGDADDVVPIAENTTPFEAKIKAAGGDIQVIHKPGIGHHPHSLPNPQPIVDFIVKATEGK